MINKEAV